MRTIKFRAWHIDDKFMFPVKCLEFGSIGTSTGDPAKFWVYVYFNESPTVDDPDPADVCFPGDAVELMQFTGLIDKNGKEIYEGDIVREGQVIGEVKYYLNRFLVFGNDGTVFYPCEQGEVIGNIYEKGETK